MYAGFNTISDLHDLRGPHEIREPLGRATERGVGEIAFTPVDLTLIPQPDCSEHMAWLARAQDSWDLLTRERGERCAYFIQEIWNLSEDARRQTLELVVQEAQRQDAELDPATLMRYSMQALAPAIDAWQAAHEERLATLAPEAWDASDHSYARLWEIVQFGHHYGIHRDSGVGGFFQRVVAMGTQDMWRLLEVVPRSFEEQVGRLPTPDERRQLFESTRSMATSFAASNIGLEQGFFNMLRHINYMTRYAPDYDHRIRPEYVVVRRESVRNAHTGNYALQWVAVISPDAIRRFNERLHGHDASEYMSWIPNMTVGCAAMAAAANSRERIPTSVLSEYEDWSIALALAALPHHSPSASRIFVPTAVSSK